MMKLKLTDDLFTNIRTLLADGSSHRTIAKKLGASRSFVGKISLGYVPKWLTDDGRGKKPQTIADEWEESAEVCSHCGGGRPVKMRGTLCSVCHSPWCPSPSPDEIRRRRELIKAERVNI